MYAGSFASTREAESLTLGDALRRLQQEGLTAKESNRRKDEVRIAEILADDIAQRSIASLARPDIAAYRDLLIERSYARKIDRAIAAAADKPGSGRRIAALRSLPRLRATMRTADPVAAREIARRIEEIEKEEGLRPPARTTIWNKVQIIHRALKLVGQSIVGVPDVSGVSMPRSSPGRARRPTEKELAAILARGGETNPLLPLIVRFAIATAFRMERVLECRTSHIQPIAPGRYAIRFPKSAARTKRTGVVPVTAEIEAVVLEAVRLHGGPGDLMAAIAADVQLFPISANALAHAWRGLLARLGISDLRLHDLRHEATSRLFERGLTAAEVMSVTGHSTNDMVDRYAHYSSALVHERMERAAAAGEEANLPALVEDIAALVRKYRAAGGEEATLALLLGRPRR